MTREGLGSRRLHGAIVGTVLATAVVGCSTTHAQRPAGSSSHSSVSRAPEASPRPTAFDVDAYQRDPARLARLNAALAAFGKVVVQESAESQSAWGPFDTYCSGMLMGGPSDPGGWTSQHYTPRPGQDCALQHHRDYGGDPGDYSVDLLVAPDGSYTDTRHLTVIGGNVQTAACNVLILPSGGSVPDVSVTIDGQSRALDDTAKTLADARAIDDAAIQCLDNTRP